MITKGRQKKKDKFDLYFLFYSVAILARYFFIFPSEPGLRRVPQIPLCFISEQNRVCIPALNCFEPLLPSLGQKSKQ